MAKSVVSSAHSNASKKRKAVDISPSPGALLECHDSAEDDVIDEGSDVAASDSISCVGQEKAKASTTSSSIVPRDCYFECGSKEATINISTGSKLGTWVCGGCYAAFRGWQHQMRRLKMTRELSVLRSTNLPAFKQKVRSMRIVTNGDLLKGIEGSRSHAEAEQVGKSWFESALVDHAGVDEEEGVIWLLQNQYIAHCKHYENYPDDASAMKAWELDFRDIDIPKRGEGKTTRIPVLEAPRTIGRKGRYEVHTYAEF
jgi:hypothetical protein